MEKWDNYIYAGGFLDGLLFAKSRPEKVEEMIDKMRKEVAHLKFGLFIDCSEFFKSRRKECSPEK